LLLTEPKDFDVDAAYRRLTGGTEGFTKGASAKLLLKPEWRYLQFLIAYNLTSRGKNYTNMTKREVWILDCIVRGIKINPAALAVYTIASWKIKAKGTMRKMGHLVTAIASYEELELDKNRVRYPTPLTMKALEKHGVVKKNEKGKYVVIPEAGEETSEEEAPDTDNEPDSSNAEGAQDTPQGSTLEGTLPEAPDQLTECSNQKEEQGSGNRKFTTLSLSPFIRTQSYALSVSFYPIL
ncbi:hypothetical protein M569_06176, partial [Genlisea aurea]